MQLKDIARALVSGGLVYVIMAACSANDVGFSHSKGRADAGAHHHGDGDGQGGHGLADASTNAGGSSGDGGGWNAGGSSGEGGGWLDAALDAIADPVPDASADDGTKDGTRLKARYYVAEDGARQFAGWYDTQRGEDCAFQIASDGKRRCLPAARVNGGTYYADSACTQPLALGSAGCTGGGGYASVGEYVGACVEYRTRLYPILGPFSGKPYYKSGGLCVQSSIEAENLMRLGAEVPPSSFVAANLQ